MYRFARAAIACGCMRGVAMVGAVFFVTTSCFGASSQTAAAHGLTLLPTGDLMGWGANEFGQVQSGQGEFVPEPRRLQLPGTKLVAVSAGGRHSLAMDAAGKVWAWGDNSSGQLGLGHTRPVTGPSKVLGLPSKVLAVAAGSQHSAALLADGSIWVWGANNRGQLGLGESNTFAVASKPTRVTGLAHALALAAGDDFLVALVVKRDKNNDAINTVWGWGSGNALPHPIKGIQAPDALRAAGDVVMVHTTSDHYWRWRMDRLPPSLASRQVFAHLGEMTHPKLASLASIDTQAIATKVSAAKPESPTNQEVSITPASTPVLPPVMPALSTPLASTTAVAPATAAKLLSVSGAIHLAEAPMENVQPTAEGAQCTTSDKQGRFVCTMAAGWSGRIRLSRNNYRFSPSALSYQNLRTDASQQDFVAIYDPR